MFGQNLKRPPLQGDGTILEVQHIFATIQGEGPYTGWPALFIRLGGCNLACSFCDTEFESFKSMSLETILKTVETLDPTKHYPLVVVTGGEPLRQPITLLCEKLLEKGYKVQLETNGTLFRPLPTEVDIVCSPKAPNGHYTPIRPDLLTRISAYKFIISANHPIYHDIGQVGQDIHPAPIYVQPMDEQCPDKNKANLQHVINLAQIHGYRISLQTHKLMGIE